MCDYSLEAMASRPAVVGEKLITHKFASHTTGFAEPNKTEMPVCVLPGSELAFDSPIKVNEGSWSAGWIETTLDATVAVFAQDPKPEYGNTWRDCLELVDGRRFKLNQLIEGQTVSVLQLPKEQTISHIDLPAFEEK